MGKNVTVTNKGEEDFAGRYDGKLYAITAGGSRTMPVHVAGFLFGYGKDDAERSRVLVRNGWQRTSDPADDYGPVEAAKRLKSFVFKSAPDDPEPERPKAVVLTPHVGPAPAMPAIKPAITLPGSSAPPAP